MNSAENEAPVLREKVKLSSRMWLGGAGCMISTLCNIITGGGLTFFFINYMGLSEGLSALCWILFGIWNAVNDPIFGWLSDKTKSKLGRRIPYIRYGSLMIAVVYILSWFTFPGESQIGMFFQMFFSLFFFDALYTAIATSLYVMPYEMAITNEARGKILLVTLIFNLGSVSVPLVLLAELKKLLTNSLHEFQLTMIIIGVVAGIIMFLSTFFYKESTYAQKEEQYPFLKSIGYCFKNKSFIVFEVISFTVTFVQTALFIGITYYFGAFDLNYIYCYIALFVGVALGLSLWLTVGLKKWGVKKSILIMCLVFIASSIVMIAFGKFLVGGMVAFLGVGFALSGGLYMVPLMNGDVIDYDEHTSGLRREGMYAGVNSFICKPAISIANAAFPLMIVSFGYDKTIDLINQTNLAKFGIIFSWFIIPLVLFILSYVLIKIFYPLYGEKWDLIKASLTKKHEDKQKEYEMNVLKQIKEEGLEE
ncbi:MAG: MFS transporter [Bacillales bacterium]|nr:MFS transporter [Bacillales bacterium]